MRTFLVKFVTVQKAGRISYIPKTLELLFFILLPLRNSRDFTYDSSLVFVYAAKLEHQSFESYIKWVSISFVIA